jgi:hypothetical protein
MHCWELQDAIHMEAGISKDFGWASTFKQVFGLTSLSNQTGLLQVFYGHFKMTRYLALYSNRNKQEYFPTYVCT